MRNSSKIFAIVLILFVVACNKYEYGPNVSLRTKKGRLSNDWDLKKVVINKSDTILNFNPIELSFDKNGEVKYTITYQNTSIGDSAVVSNGDWTFNNDGLDLILILTDSLGQKNAELFEIINLTKDQLWLSKMILSDQYYYYFEQK